MSIKSITKFKTTHQICKRDGLLICSIISIREKLMNTYEWIHMYTIRKGEFIPSHHISSNKKADINSQNTKDYTISFRTLLDKLGNMYGMFLFINYVRKQAVGYLIQSLISIKIIHFMFSHVSFTSSDASNSLSETVLLGAVFYRQGVRQA